MENAKEAIFLPGGFARREEEKNISDGDGPNGTTEMALMEIMWRNVGVNVCVHRCGGNFHIRSLTTVQLNAFPR